VSVWGAFRPPTRTPPIHLIYNIEVRQFKEDWGYFDGRCLSKHPQSSPKCVSATTFSCFPPKGKALS
jgi:hypothetical protein